MNSRLFRNAGLACAAWLAAASAHAAPITWSYNWSRNPVDVFSTSKDPITNEDVVDNTSRLYLSDEPLRTASGDSDVVATNIDTFSSAFPTDPAQFTNRIFKLTMFLQDGPSSASTTLDFNGFFSGTLSESSSNIAATFTGTTVYEDLRLGDNLYTVSIGPYAPPGPPVANNLGSISAHVTVKPFDDDDEENPPPPPPPPPHGAPEPSTVLLSCLGLSFLGAAAVRKRLAKKSDGNA